MIKKAHISAIGFITDGQPVNFMMSGSLDGVQIGGLNSDGDEVWFSWTLAELAEVARERDEALQEPEYLALVRELRGMEG